MYLKLIAVGAICALATTAAVAQGSNSTQNASATGEWQASKLIHMNVYNGQNQKSATSKN